MSYQIIIPKKVQKDLNRIDSRYRSRITTGLIRLASNPYIGKKLEGEHRGKWSFLVWPYRIIYQINKRELIVLVVKIGHRQGVYRLK